MVTQLCFSLKSTLICRAFAFNFTAKSLQEPEVYPVFIQIEMCHRKILHFKKLIHFKARFFKALIFNIPGNISSLHIYKCVNIH